MENIIEAIEKTIFDEPLADLAIDYLDIGLDMITDSDIIEAIPVVKTFVSLYKGTMSIKERFFAKKLMIFASEIYNGNVPENEIIRRKEAIENNEKWIRKEIEEIAIFLDRFDFEYKAKILAKLYVAFLKNIICAEKYLNMLSIIDKWQKSDNDLLKTIYKKYKSKTLNIANGERDYVILIDKASQQRLESLGVLNIKREVINLLNKFEGLLDDKEIEEIMKNGEYSLEETYELNYEGIILAEILSEGKVITKFDEKYFNLSSM